VFEKTEDSSQESGERMRSSARSFQNLVVWKKAHQFVLSVYDLTGKSPGTEIYGLTSNILNGVSRLEPLAHPETMKMFCFL